MGSILTEKTSLALRKDTVQELQQISEMIHRISKGERCPKTSELIRYALYRFIDDVLYPDKNSVFQNIKSGMKDSAFKNRYLINIEFTVKHRDFDTETVQGEE